jgi:glycine hydroxymethyltransferase
VVDNAREFVSELSRLGIRIVSGRTDTHLLLADLRSLDITGRDASDILEKINITVNKNLIPFDPKSPFITSGIRIGTPAVTTRGVGVQDITRISKIIYECLKNKDKSEILSSLKQEVKNITEEFPLYPEIDI